MGWEQRNGQSYYYRKKRVGERILSEYVGRGVFAEICAETDRNQRRELQDRRDAHSATLQAEAEVERSLAEMETTVAAITDITLHAAGYHKYKGQWRKKRHEKETSQEKNEANTSG